MNLDDSIEKCLPGVIQGNGYGGNQITIRQILNHTSGIADYINSKDFDITDIKKSYTAEEFVKMGISLPQTLPRERVGLIQTQDTYYWGSLLKK